MAMAKRWLFFAAVAFVAIFVLASPQLARQPCPVPEWDALTEEPPYLLSAAEMSLRGFEKRASAEGFLNVGETFGTTAVAAFMFAVVYDPAGRFDPSRKIHRFTQRMALALVIDAALLAVARVWLLAICPAHTATIWVSTGVLGYMMYTVSQGFLGSIATLRLQLIASASEAKRAAAFLKCTMISFVGLLLAYNARYVMPQHTDVADLIFLLGAAVAGSFYIAFQAQSLGSFTAAARAAFREASHQGAHVSECRLALWTAMAAWASAATTILWAVSFVLRDRDYVGPAARLWLVHLCMVVDLASDACLALLCSGLIGPDALKEVDLSRVGELAVEHRKRQIHDRLVAIAKTSTGPAAAVASLVEGSTPEELIELAVSRFRAVPWPALARRSDIIIQGASLDQAGAGACDLHLLSKPCQLTKCDAFWSHSWHDNGQLKWQAMSQWTAEFKQSHGRWPSVWLDKICIDQTSIQEDLRCLPIFLAGCERLVITAGSTYTERLWCCMELFVYMTMQTDAVAPGSLAMGALPSTRSSTMPAKQMGTTSSNFSASQSMSSLHGVMRSTSSSSSAWNVRAPLSSTSVARGLSRSTAASKISRPKATEPVLLLLGSEEDRSQAALAWHRFDVRSCRCFDAGDKTRMMHVVEECGTGVDGFNTFIRELAGRLFPDSKKNDHDAADLELGWSRGTDDSIDGPADSEADSFYVAI